MRKLVPALAVGIALAFSGNSGAQNQDGSEVAIINIQAAIAQSNDGQEAARMLQDKFAPKRTELEQQQSEIAELQNRLRNQEKTLSEEARRQLVRTLEEKTRAFNRANEDATTEFQQAEQDAINEIGRKMMEVVSRYAQEQGYRLVVDVGSPQTPVLYADASIDITEKIIELYNQASTAGASGSSSQ